MAYRITQACALCGACLPECPTGSIVAGTKQYYIDADTCANHATCVSVCPENAIVPIAGTVDAGAPSEEEEE